MVYHNCNLLKYSTYNLVVYHTGTLQLWELITDREVEVVLSLERQNELIHNCHYGVCDTLQSKVSAGHYGM